MSLPFFLTMSISDWEQHFHSSGGIAAFGLTRYKVASPHQYLIKTGIGIRDMQVSKNAILWPLQKLSIVDMRPHNYNFELHNMSREKVEFRLPINFTIGPIDPIENPSGFLCFGRRMNEMEPETVNKTILGVVEGETRGLTSVLTIEEMFNAKDRFRNEVVEKIQCHLEPLGLKISFSETL